MIDTGHVDVVRNTADGEVLLGTLGPGDHLGEMGPLFGLRRSASVRARVDTMLTGYTAKAFRDGGDNLGVLRCSAVRQVHR